MLDKQYLQELIEKIIKDADALHRLMGAISINLLKTHNTETAIKNLVFQLDDTIERLQAYRSEL